MSVKEMPRFGKIGEDAMCPNF
ncbi:hypothetical protein CCACVL1_01423 [Corchorus capsularis]|uniref:Uncharacterized protein n=1 Tax=Corchorus capsularis TaxID=210143 RepID=A0A1R3KII6_COCAP|nr:hypothetical protein CCACVL1_01423 [Corchorus capsularis]